MDLHIVGAEPSEAERAAVDRLLGPPVSGWGGGERDIARDGRAAVGGRSLTGDRDRLLPALHAVQDAMGWISRGALNYICRRLTVPPAEAWGVVTFYHLLATEPQSGNIAHVCDDIACRLHGLDTQIADLTSQGFTVKRSPCLGQCDYGAAALITRAGKDPQRFVVKPAVVPHLGALGAARLLKRIGRVDPSSLDEYRRHGGYSALAKAIEMGPARVIAEVTAAKLMGRGGAAFPTGRKWEAVARESSYPHYVVCNADESEPGTFKDRVVMEQDPFAVIEAMTICGFATGAARGFIYIRGEYPEAERAIGHAIAQAAAAGYLGPDIARSGFAFGIEIRRGGGAYICGEETALFNSIEGKRGEPRSKPPFPAQSGLFGKPTVVNNVETLVNVLDIVNEGGEAWANSGTPASTGSRLFCLSGHVVNPGLYEIECGRTLREAIELAGGIHPGRRLQAVLLGGAAGTFVGPDALDMPLSFEGARAAGATLGSGVIMVFDDTADLHDTLRRIAEFFKHESCGQCVPCRVGTVRQLEMLSASAGGARVADRTYAELAQAMRDASICGLGQTAASAIESAFANVLRPRPEDPNSGGHV
ncbi:MAG TPA: NADH-ubiquinone oxidoreductase-F iron-sulfur binding region domain-containing protein [Vicinamibacterales bacterium]|nr:NADH-ubiquinone oxidoreductase-F iron-sulfur binding region domain-containing protein [Vicinamibacterales bacterium]